jgi:uncharacterized membrane protein
MDWTVLWKWVHVLSATVLFGTGVGTAFQMWMAHRSRNVAAVATVARHVVVADWLFTLPAAVLQPLSGLMLAHAIGFSPHEPWLNVSYALYAIAAACWIPVVAIQIRVRDLATVAALSGTPLPHRYHALMAWWFWLGWPAFLSLLAIFALMIAKPQFA